jgi:hypothetical protein
MPWGKWGGLNDFLAFGDCESMITWGKRFDSMHEFMEVNGINSEQHVNFVCNKHNIKNIDLPMLCCRTRANGNKKMEEWAMDHAYRIKDKCIQESGEINADFFII